MYGFDVRFTFRNRLQSHVAVLLGQACGTLGAQQLKGGNHACTGVGSVAGHISGTGGNGVGSAAHLSGILGSLGVGGSNDVVGSVDLGLVQDRDGSIGLQSADGAAVDGDLQVCVGQSGVDRATALPDSRATLAVVASA